MHKIFKSFFPTEEHENSFQRLVNDHIWEMESHDRHMANVKKDPKNYQAYPAPTAHPDIISAITKEKGKYAIAYEIVDDAPKLTLEEKKNNLSHQLQVSINKAFEEIIPQRKRGMINIERSKILVVDEKDRTKQQKKWLIDFETKEIRAAKITEFQAQVESDIHDLTEKTIDGWKLPPLPGV